MEEPQESTIQVVSTKEKILRVGLSSLLGAVVGVIIAEVVANSLIEISLTYAFAVVCLPACQLWCLEVADPFAHVDLWRRISTAWCCARMEDLDEC